MKFSLTIILALVAGTTFSQTDILSTDFQMGIPVSYTVVDNDGNTPAASVSEFTSAWITKQDPENSADTVAASTSYFDPASTANRWLITPPLALGNYGNFINWEAKSHDASFPDDYLVLVSTTDNQIASFTDTIGYVIEENFEWTSREVNLSDFGYNSQTIYVAFVNVTEDGFKLYLDDIHAWKDDPVGIKEMNYVSLNVYPNPSDGLINISSDDKVLKIEVFSSNQQLVLSTTESEINLRNTASGVYFIKVYTETGIAVRKVIIK